MSRDKGPSHEPRGLGVVILIAALLLLILVPGHPGHTLSPAISDRAPTSRPPVFDPADEFPGFFDWRQNGGNYLTPVRSQSLPGSSCSSCWAFSAVAAAESMLEIEAEDPNWNPDLSEQMVVSCSSGSCDPDTIPTALDFMAAEGVADEACMSYGANGAIACESACRDWPQRTWFAGDWRAVAGDERSLKRALLQGPVIAKMDLYADFFRYEGGVYPCERDSLSFGGHFVLLTGWDDASGAWIGKNSYGPDWGEDTNGATGERGWFRIAYHACDIGSSAYLLESVSAD